MKQEGWADFVFAPEYQLPSLSETEAYIRQHKHLPGVPDAQEVEENGIDVGEMNKVLLQKVEELTLHLIDGKHKRGSHLIWLNPQVRRLHLIL